MLCQAKGPLASAFVQLVDCEALVGALQDHGGWQLHSERHCHVPNCTIFDIWILHDSSTFRCIKVSADHPVVQLSLMEVYAKISEPKSFPKHFTYFLSLHIKVRYGKLLALHPDLFPRSESTSCITQALPGMGSVFCRLLSAEAKEVCERSFRAGIRSNNLHVAIATVCSVSTCSFCSNAKCIDKNTVRYVELHNHRKMENFH